MSGVSLRLEVDRWRRHLVTVAESTPSVMPRLDGRRVVGKTPPDDDGAWLDSGPVGREVI